MPSAVLSDRAVVSLRGGGASAFLDRLVTCDVGPISPGHAGFGALLSPQGKILADFVLHAPNSEGEPEFLFDVAGTCASELMRRLSLYRLRAKLVIEDRTSSRSVVVGWSGAPRPEGAFASAPDPRLPDLGWRAVVPHGAELPGGGAEAYHAHRIGLGVPEAGRDFPFGDAFPHEAMMDQLGGVDFGKGCYVGQEIVSRMQHRGTARTRTVPVAYEGPAAAPGVEVTAGGRVLGRTGEAAGARGLATVRLDRVADAIAAGEPILAGDSPLQIEKPAWARFAFPGEATTGAA